MSISTSRAWIAQPPHSLDEVLAVRNRQGVELARWLSAVTDGDLSRPRFRAGRLGWPAVLCARQVCAGVPAPGAQRAMGHQGFCECDITLLED